MPKSSFNHALIFLLATGLAACGGGAGSSASGGSASGGSASGGSASGGSASGIGGAGGTGGDEPPARIAQLYDGLGLMPAELNDGLVANEQVADAVAPGYLALAALAATADLRLNLQAFGWQIPELIHKMAQPIEGETQSPPCRVSGHAYIVSHDDQDQDGEVDSGEEVVFRYGDCVPAGGMRALRSGGAEQHYLGGRSNLQDQFLLSQTSMAGYDGLLVGSSDWLLRYYLEGYQECSSDTGAAVECEQMVFTNRSADGADATLGQLTIEQVGSESPLRLSVWNDGTAATAADIETYVVFPEQRMVFQVDGLDLHLDPGAGGAAERAGNYTLRTLEGGMTLTYETRSFAQAGFKLAAGGFSVTGPTGDTVYTYTLPEGADPVYATDLRVTIDRDGDGTPDDVGLVSQALVMQRLRLAQ
jgi:hypothetical protein